jgi:hypothetical protein
MQRLVIVLACALGMLSGGVRAAEDPAISSQVEGSAAAEPRAGSRLGIGFLWTQQSRNVVSNLTAAQDFVDVILDPGKLDIFNNVKRPVRVACISLALQKMPTRPLPGIKETIKTLRKAGVPPDRVIIAYNPERSPGTPSSELDDLVASARAAKAMAEAYGAPLLVGPGLQEMMTREPLYPELAKICDIWLIQSQRLQLDADTRKPVAPAKYRTRVKRIVGILRQANPKIRIFVQVVTTAERGTTVLTAEQVAAFALAIEDLVDAVRIYGAPGDLLTQIIERLHAPHPAAFTPEDPAI